VPKLKAPVAIADSTAFPPSPTSIDERADTTTHEVPENPNRNAFSAALSCYPYSLTPHSPLDPKLTHLYASIVKEIARAVDLNTLHALSRTCRQFHVNLAPFRHQLVRETLRCENEYIETVAEMLDGRALLPNSVKSVLRLLSQGNGEGRMTRGKVGKCARDMVSECRRCNKVVCRVGPPTNILGTKRLIILELHDQTSLPSGAEEPYSSSMPNMRDRPALLPSFQHTSRTNHRPLQ